MRSFPLSLTALRVRESSNRPRLSRLVIVYVMGVIVLCSADIVYAWRSPLVSETGEATNWWAFAGVRAGYFGMGHSELGSAGFAGRVHWPQFSAVPLFAGTGPDSGGVFIAVWLVGLVASSSHAVARLRV